MIETIQPLGEYRYFNQCYFIIFALPPGQSQ